MSKRIERVNQLIKKELSQIILKEIEFARDVLVTVTRVETLPNLLESNVWVSVFPEEKFEIIFEILNKNIYFLQQKLNQKLKMRPVPKINFFQEKKTAQAGKIEEILEKLKKEKNEVK